MDEQDSTPYGHCRCGCGLKTSISEYTCNTRGYVKGEPRYYVRGHARKTPWLPPTWHVDAGSGCWLWDGSLDHKGYGRIYDPAKGKAIGAYRWVYEQHKGPVPEGLEMDHICRTPRCVNPDHLEPVTTRENQRRGVAARGRQGCVSFITSKGRWRAVVRVEGRQRSLGYFGSYEDGRLAMDAYLAQEGL